MERILESRCFPDLRRGRLRLRAGRIAGWVPLPDQPPAEDPLPPESWRLPDDVSVLPGFVDGHTHLLGVGLARLRPDLEGSASREEALERVRSWLAAHPGDGPVIGEGWDESLWPDGAPPTRRDLDGISPRRPVALRRVCGHAAVLNRAALELVGGDWPNVDLESGMARESLALSLSRIWAPGAEQLATALEIAQAEALRRGVTSIQEMGRATSFRVFGRASAEGRLRIRVSHFFQSGEIDTLEKSGLACGFGDARLRVAGLKLFLDGSIGARSAAFRIPYPEAAGNRSAGSGLLLWEDADLLEFLERASDADLPVAIHAIGDRAIEQAIHCVEETRRRGKAPAPPGARLEHAEALAPDLLERASEAGFRFSMQPNFTARWQGPGELYEQVLGRERSLRLNPYDAARRTGRLHFGSDCMPLDPLLGLRGALGHPDGEQRLPFREAVEAYTSTAATAVRRPFGQATLGEGEPADLVAIRMPPNGSPGDTLAGARVVATWVDGALGYADPDLPVPPGFPRCASPVSPESFVPSAPSASSGGLGARPSSVAPGGSVARREP